MMTNPEGFMALGGHAHSVSQAARRLSERRETPDRTPSEAAANAFWAERSARDWLLSRAGDGLIAMGTWLKTHSGQVSYERA